jgi:hypothetical protein
MSPNWTTIITFIIAVLDFYKPGHKYSLSIHICGVEFLLLNRTRAKSLLMFNGGL